MGELKIHIRQFQTVQKSTGQIGYYQGTSPANLTFVQGTLPTARQWPTFPNWWNATEYASDIYKLKITFSQQYDNQGNLITEGGVGQKRTTTGSVTFESEAFFLIKKWLVDDISASLNIVEVMIEDVGCGKYLNLQITQEELSYCEGQTNCVFEVNIKQLEEPLVCLQRTIISDNWQGWFPQNGQPVSKRHPRFSYCNETKPNALLIVMWYFLTVFGFVVWILFTVIFVALIPILLVIYAIALFLGGTTGSGGAIGILNLVPGVNLNPLNPNAGDIWNLIQTLVNAINGGIIDGIANMFIESGGCGREHPAPLIRDYITNVCGKCGIAVNAESVPLFLATQLTINTSDPNRGQIQVNNPYYNACYFNPIKNRGIRRFKTFSILTGVSNLNNSDYWIEDNRPIMAGTDFFDHICKLYNQQWIVENVNNSGQQVPTLKFFRKDHYKLAGAPLFNFGKGQPDRLKLIKGICYSWNSRVMPAITKGLYAIDASDECGREALKYYNGSSFIIHGNIDTNPNFEGELDKTQQIGTAKFRLDGASNDYILDALQVNLLANFLTSIFFLPIYNAVRNALSDYADYAVLMQGETCSLPKIIIWDGASFNNAKAIKTIAATPNNGATPQINTYYNKTSTPWSVEHAPDTNVLGNFLAPQNVGSYTVQGILVPTIVRPAYLVNYPMFFDTNFYGNMWDYFHWIDDPTRNVFTNQDFVLRIVNCCDDLKTLGVFNNSLGVALSRKIIVDNKYQAAKITEVTVSYDTSEEDGQFIEIKGEI